MDAAGFMPSEAALAKVRSEIEAYEAEREKTGRAVWVRRVLFLAILAVLTIVLTLAFNSFADPREQFSSSPHFWLYVVAAILVPVLYSAANGPANKLQQSVRDRLLPVIFGFIDDVRYRKGDVPDSFSHIPKDTIGAHSDVDFDDEIVGVWQGWPFELYEAKATVGSGKSQSTVFQGVVITLKTEQPFPGELIAARRATSVTSFFRGIFGNELEEITSPDPFVNERYHFRTDNPEAAAPLVTGRMTQALKWLGETWPDEPARIAMNHDDVFLLLPHSKNFFELPPISVPLDYKTHVAPMIADMATLLATASLVRQIGASDETAPAT